MTRAEEQNQARERQRAEWNAVASGWKRWSPSWESTGRLVSMRLVALAGITSGARVLDVATGLGEPALTAAEVVGPTGFVVATDQSEAMLAAARERAAERGMHNVRFVLSGAESLDVGETGFDAALCRWGLMFVPDLRAAAAAISRLLRPGARFATAVWPSPEKVAVISLSSKRVRELAQLGPPKAGELDPFRLSERRPLYEALDAAGFKDAREEELELVFEFESPASYTAFQCEVAAPFRALIDRVPADLRDKLLAATTRAAQDYARPDGSVRIPSQAILVVASKAA